MDILTQKLKNRSDQASKDFIQGVERNNAMQIYNAGSALIGKVGGWEEYDLLEVVFTSALDCGEMNVAETCLAKILKQFPDSLRAKKLEGLLFESKEEWIRAADIYNEILEKEPTNRPAARRLIAIVMAKGRNEDTIQAFNNYLSVHQADTETWLEFANFYLRIDELKNASFCLEECLLANPKDFHALTRLGEIFYTIGGSDNILLARRYFSNAVELNPKSTRPLFGLYKACSNLSPKDLSGTDQSVNRELLEYSRDRLLEIYSKDQVGREYVEKALVI